jgi:hypothetical protein
MKFPGRKPSLAPRKKSALEAEQWIKALGESPSQENLPQKTVTQKNLNAAKAE